MERPTLSRSYNARYTPHFTHATRRIYMPSQTPSYTREYQSVIPTGVYPYLLMVQLSHDQFLVFFGGGLFKNGNLTLKIIYE